ncbi:hypothetical protein [Halobacillus sp. H74]|uniref:hypothetical protein n=1 Tax=Halobacillus sp. H74 TaxID=3457436 RepID=UPI003FCE020F
MPASGFSFDEYTMPMDGVCNSRMLVPGRLNKNRISFGRLSGGAGNAGIFRHFCF